MLAGMLIVMAGLPGAGKSAVAEDVGRTRRAPVLSVDPIEAAMWRAGVAGEQPTGLAAYVVAEVLAEAQLALGLDVIVDAVNDAERARQQWRDLAQRSGAVLRFVEVRCSDEDVHRRRLAQRERGLEGFQEPDWPSVLARCAGFRAWDEERLSLDSMHPRAHNARLAMAYLSQS
jgi:predicted kinase